MAQRVEVMLIDDITGDEAHQTVKFSLDGSMYEIDLADVRAAELRTKLDRYVAAARKQQSITRTPRKRRLKVVA